MKDISKVLFLFILLFIVGNSQAQVKKYTPANAHSHNDYLADTPFYRAYKAGFGSIEADVFPVKGELYVAHNKNQINPQRTLTALYLNPIASAFASDSTRRLILLIDVKENYKEALSLLINQLQPVQTYLSTLQVKNRLTILISGNRPPPSEYKNYPPFIFFDDDLVLPHTKEQWKRVGLVSLSFTKYVLWNGKDQLNYNDETRLKHTIDSVHTAGKGIRYWAAPDTETSWKQQMKLGVDLIGTDKIDDLGRWLQRQSHY